MGAGFFLPVRTGSISTTVTIDKAGKYIHLNRNRVRHEEDQIPAAANSRVPRSNSAAASIRSPLWLSLSAVPFYL
jgi:hypothetical protein